MVDVSIKGKIIDGESYILQVDEEHINPWDLEGVRDNLKEAFPKSHFLILVGGLRSVSIDKKDEFIKALKEAGII